MHTPALRAAKTNIQLEFTRVVESIRRSDDYKGRNLLYIAGLKINISENENLPVMNYFVPWAAHVQLKDGTQEESTNPIEQNDQTERSNRTISIQNSWHRVPKTLTRRI